MQRLGKITGMEFCQKFRSWVLKNQDTNRKEINKNIISNKQKRQEILTKINRLTIQKINKNYKSNTVDSIFWSWYTSRKYWKKRGNVDKEKELNKIWPNKKVRILEEFLEYLKDI
jgi:hypothetical protein